MITYDKQVLVRMEKNQYDSLMEEARRNKLPISSYIRMITANSNEKI